MVDFVTICAARKEATYGTDVNPTLAANAILTRNFSASPIEVDRVERNLDARAFGNTGSIPSNERGTVQFEVELAGSGAAGTAPRWMELLDGAGMAAPTLTAGVSAVQQMAAATAAQTSMSIHHWIGDQRRRLVGARGTFSLDFTAGQLPFASLQYLGLIPAATPFQTAAPTAATLTAWREPLEVCTTNTVLTLDGYAAPMRSLKIDAAVPTVLRNLVGAKYVRRGNHKMTGQLSIEAPALGQKDLIAPLRSGARVPLSLIHGVGAGNIIELAAPAVQILNFKERNEDDVLMWDLDLAFTITTGADELTITAK